VISFFDRREDSNNLLYHEYYADVSIDGVALQANQRISTFPSDPREHVGVAVDGVAAQFLGDYQDMWNWSYGYGERAVTAFPLIPVTLNSELYLSRITY
jgi:hypothetical protein